MNRWKGSTEPADPSGVATFTVEGKQVAIRLQCFADYHAILALVEYERRQSLQAHTQFIRGALNRLLDTHEV